MLICLFTCGESLCPYTCTPKTDCKNNPAKDGDFGEARNQPAEALLAEQAKLGGPGHHADARGRGTATRTRGGCGARDALLPPRKSKAEALAARLSRGVGYASAFPKYCISHAPGFASDLLQMPMSIRAPKDGHIRRAAVFLGEGERGGQEAVCRGKDGLQKGNCTRGKVFPPTLRRCASISTFLHDTAALVLSIALVQAIGRSGKCC